MNWCVQNKLMLKRIGMEPFSRLWVAPFLPLVIVHINYVFYSLLVVPICTGLLKIGIIIIRQD